jgi:hypothetical protein
MTRQELDGLAARLSVGDLIELARLVLLKHYPNCVTASIVAAVEPDRQQAVLPLLHGSSKVVG